MELLMLTRLRKKSLQYEYVLKEEAYFSALFVCIGLSEVRAQSLSLHYSYKDTRYTCSLRNR